MLDARDHRSLGPKLDLFHLQEEAPGSVFWHPRGWVLFRLIEEHVRRAWRAGGYLEVRSPQVLHQSIWERSGHWEHFRADMLPVGEHAALKPVSCPGHIALFRRAAPSYRQLPLRFAEFGLCHRNEASGALQGLLRLRQFSQDDGHIFCAEEDAGEELVAFIARLRRFYASFGFVELDVAFSGRPERRGGDEQRWSHAERLLSDAAAQAGLLPRIQPGQGAFYGPKLEFGLPDRDGRVWQCGTIQVDQVLPERFELSFVASSGERKRPVILHRALLGSLERFIALLLEHHGAALPAWLAPEQVRIASVSESPYPAQLAAQLVALGLRAHHDKQEGSLGKKIAEAHALGIPFVCVIGAREAKDRCVSLRDRSGKIQILSLEAALSRIAIACAPPEP